MKTEANYRCDDPDSNFYVPEVSYSKTIKVTCEVNKIFGKKFPYWEIPGTNYPAVKEIYCALPTSCYNFYDVDPPMGPIGLSDNFDFYTNKIGDQFQYFCSMDGDRGILFPFFIKKIVYCVTSGYIRFRTPSPQKHSYHFISNKTLLEKEFRVRIFPKGPVQIAFTNTQNQTNHTLVIMLENTKTTIFQNGSKSKDEVSMIKYNTLNDIHIRFTKAEISVNKHLFINGDFHFLRFIGFDSTLDSSWVVQESKKFICRITAYDHDF